MTSDITPITAASKGGTTAQTAIEIPGYVTMITPAEKWSMLCGATRSLHTPSSRLASPACPRNGRRRHDHR